MKLLRFITQEEYERLLTLSQREDLQSDNKENYYHAERLKDDEDVKWVNALLTEVIEDFASFSNFRKDNPDWIRLQYAWGPHFTGVGWIKLTELRDGFPSETE